LNTKSAIDSLEIWR